MLLIAAVCLNQTLSFFGGVGGRGNGGQDPEIGHLLMEMESQRLSARPPFGRMWESEEDGGRARRSALHVVTANSAPSGETDSEHAVKGKEAVRGVPKAPKPTHQPRALAPSVGLCLWHSPATPHQS
ncbi:hypothetical protein DFH08DRAFT_820866 [Mycena albidolilacea]|uniref:Uncharacterized protein n=1 Tax=Mycena albidolilacea TaxID=1033008 RepID=A0AAD6ZAZ4_9AGAR|nr:hypothetical protein DFH08DRAFT_820866 [Mycena albidolilacea]